MLVADDTGRDWRNCVPMPEPPVPIHVELPALGTISIGAMDAGLQMDVPLQGDEDEGELDVVPAGDL